jgi:2-keto-4-pentenoate hydratase/2-oxohepta-3-ene-1,7-dioic acid hydratase in catechol pathway
MIQLPIAGRKEKYTVSPSKILCLGLNYSEHVAEHNKMQSGGTKIDLPEEPILFSKTPNVLIGPDVPIVIPAFLKEYGFATPRVDHEAELAILIKDTCKDVSKADAYDHIFGFTCMNDVSQRNIQHGDESGWFRGKSLDTFGPIGPVVVPVDEMKDPQSLEIVCRVNGTERQHANTSAMIFQIPEIIAFISKHFTLVQGDIIMTGTPSGVSPITHGDTVEVEIEQIGILKNPVVEEGK